MSDSVRVSSPVPALTLQNALEAYLQTAFHTPRLCVTVTATFRDDNHLAQLLLLASSDIAKDGSPVMEDGADNDEDDWLVESPEGQWSESRLPGRRLLTLACHRRQLTVITIFCHVDCTTSSSLSSRPAIHCCRCRTAAASQKFSCIPLRAASSSADS